MITAIIRNKENTLVLELPHSIYDIYEKLQSIGIMQPPKQIPLTDNEGEDIGVKLFSESDFGQHLLLTLNEKNTIADANMLTLVIGAASEDIKEELEQNILYDQYDSMDEVINAVRQMTQDAGPVKAAFFCPLVGNIDEGDGDMFTVGDSYLADSADEISDALNRYTANDENDMVRRTCSMSIFKNRTVIGVICILLALVICFGITPLFNQSISQKAEIVRVTKDIHAGELITRDMVTTAEVGSYNLPSGLMTAKDNVVGKYAKADLAVGDYILAAKLSDAPAAENAYLYNLDGTKQAISVTIKSFATGLSGKLQSGDIVSVIVADYPEDSETTIPAELQYVEIISVTASTGYDANTGEAKGDEKELPSTVTFLVLPEQAKVLAELEQVAKLHLALVYRGTTDGARQFIEAQDALIEELYAEPEEDPIEEGESADPTAEMPESEVTG